jgi:hypothetical protein
MTETLDGKDLQVQDGLNKTSIYCLRCACLILKASSAKLYHETMHLPSIRKDESGECPQYYWAVRDMMSFENIGFTKSVSQKRYLACAECDLGPLGLQTDQIYLAADRVKYEI